MAGFEAHFSPYSRQGSPKRLTWLASPNKIFKKKLKKTVAPPSDRVLRSNTPSGRPCPAQPRAQPRLSHNLTEGEKDKAVLVDLTRYVRRDVT